MSQHQQQDTTCQNGHQTETIHTAGFVRIQAARIRKQKNVPVEQLHISKRRYVMTVKRNTEILRQI